MEGRITLRRGDAEWSFALPRAEICLTGLATGNPELTEDASRALGGVAFEWVPRLRSWGCREPVPDGTPGLKSRHFRDEDEMVLGDWWIGFRRVWAPPEC